MSASANNVFLDIAPGDILTVATTRAKLERPTRLAASKMKAAQFDALMSLIAEYANGVPPDVAEQRCEGGAGNSAREDILQMGRATSRKPPAPVVVGR
jgi:hypothetical protein